MATPKKFPTDKPDVSSPRRTTSSAQPCESVSIPQVAFENLTPYRYINLAFIGRPGSGRNSLAWRMDNLNDSELPALPSLPRREMVLRTETRPALRHAGTIAIQIRIVPPEDFHGQTFFDKRGGINESEFIVFVVDLGDEKSSNEFYPLLKKAQQNVRGEMPPYIIVGNKVDLRMFGLVTPHRWGEGTASAHSARAYMECSAKNNDRVGDVLDAILKILL